MIIFLFLSRVPGVVDGRRGRLARVPRGVDGRKGCDGGGVGGFNEGERNVGSRGNGKFGRGGCGSVVGIVWGERSGDGTIETVVHDCVLGGRLGGEVELRECLRKEGIFTVGRARVGWRGGMC